MREVLSPKELESYFVHIGCSHEQALKLIAHCLDVSEIEGITIEDSWRQIADAVEIMLSK